MGHKQSCVFMDQQHTSYCAWPALWLSGRLGNRSCIRHAQEFVSHGQLVDRSVDLDIRLDHRSGHVCR